jgi:hypothetical protein
MRSFFLPVLLLLLLASCSPGEREIILDPENTVFILWDMEGALIQHQTLRTRWESAFPRNHYIHGNASKEEEVAYLQSLLSALTEDQACLLVVATRNPAMHEVLEWNLWMPRLWRSLRSRVNILVADGPWGAEYIDTLKTKKAKTRWVLNQPLDILRRKLPGSLVAAASRTDEMNLVTMSLDGKTKTPLFSYYFLQALIEDNGRINPPLEALRTAKEKTETALAKGVLLPMEEMFFFQRSEIETEGFFHFPHPRIWNGLDGTVTWEQKNEQ